MAGSSPASSSSFSEGEALVLESLISDHDSSSMNSSAAEAVIFIRLAPISFDEDGFETTSDWLYHEPLSLAASCSKFFLSWSIIFFDLVRLL